MPSVRCPRCHRDVDDYEVEYVVRYLFTPSGRRLTFVIPQCFVCNVCNGYVVPRADFFIALSRLLEAESDCVK